jgi:hypothetical protein
VSSTSQALKALASLDDDQVVTVLGTVLGERSSFRLMRDDLLATLGSALSADRVRDALTEASLRDATRPDPTHLAEQLRIEAEARAVVLGHPMFDARQVADLVGSRGSNRRDAASALRRASVLVGISHGGKVWYPSFQIDAQRAVVRPVVREVNEMLRAADDPWGVASWWLTPSARRHDHRSPADLAVADEDEAIRRLAHALIAD